MTKLKIPGVTFSWKRALGITKIKQKIARETGIPTTKQGLERKIGGELLKLFKRAIIFQSDTLFVISPRIPPHFASITFLFDWIP